MKGVNKVILLGNVGKDPEMKYTPSGVAVAKFTIATSDRYKDKDGEWQDKTEWHSLTAFQRTAEIVGEYVKKGRPVYIEGKLQTSSWEKDGEKKYRTEIIVDQIVLLGGKDNDSGDSRPAKRADEESTYVTDEDVPF